MTEHKQKHFIFLWKQNDTSLPFGTSHYRCCCLRSMHAVYIMSTIQDVIRSLCASFNRHRGAQSHTYNPHAHACTKRAKFYGNLNMEGHSTQTHAHRRTSNYLIALGEETNVYRGTRGSQQLVGGPSKNSKDRLSSCWYSLSCLVFVFEMVLTNCKEKFGVVIQY